MYTNNLSKILVIPFNYRYWIGKVTCFYSFVQRKSKKISHDENLRFRHYGAGLISAEKIWR